MAGVSGHSSNYEVERNVPRR